MEKSIKLAVTGKGGVGKTTVSSLLCKAFVDIGYSVLAAVRSSSRVWLVRFCSGA